MLEVMWALYPIGPGRGARDGNQKEWWATAMGQWSAEQRQWR